MSPLHTTKEAATAINHRHMANHSASTSPMRDARPTTPPPSHSLPNHLSAAGSAKSDPHQHLNHPIRDPFWKDKTTNPLASPTKSTASSSILSSYQSINSQGELVPHRRYSRAPTPAGSGSPVPAPVLEIDIAVPLTSPKRKRDKESPKPLSKKPKIESLAIEDAASPISGANTSHPPKPAELQPLVHEPETTVRESQHSLPTAIGADIAVPRSEQTRSTTTTAPTTDETPTTMGRSKPRNKRAEPTQSSKEASLKTRNKTRPERTPAIPAINTRPSRVRKAPERLVEKQMSPEKASPAAKTGVRGSKVFDPVYMTTNSNSRLAKVKTDLYVSLLLLFSAPLFPPFDYDR